MPILLLLATFVTTLFAGSFLAGGNPFVRPADLLLGLMFNVPLLSILGIHELGHYAAARHHRVDVTPPFFLPAPSFIGTFGAFIRIRSPIPHRNALFDVGISGPLAGAVVAIPVLMIGLSLSAVRPEMAQGGTTLGESLAFQAVARLVLGPVTKGFDVVLHPMAFAGWIGLFVTMLNLIPAGQLDGGHIAYALLGDRYAEVARLVPYALLLMGMAWVGWFVWAALLFFLGTRHPRTVSDELPLSAGRKILGGVAVLLFLLCFSLNPFPIGRG
ncbi:site-2 protease family protein [Candidatus Deferrimicrobium sp.]|uniref:site-2 protease family protein n=1 Tax=Candidatus Deferrimicrobium sp. TaxID=3060586 RepID=UPI002EDAE7FA